MHLLRFRSLLNKRPHLLASTMNLRDSLAQLLRFTSNRFLIEVLAILNRPSIPQHSPHLNFTVKFTLNITKPTPVSHSQVYRVVKRTTPLLRRCTRSLTRISAVPVPVDGNEFSFSLILQTGCEGKEVVFSIQRDSNAGNVFYIEETTIPGVLLILLNILVINQDLFQCLNAVTLIDLFNINIGMAISYLLNKDGDLLLKPEIQI